jgi:protein-S-isoprenylcysteine O-methyltransferase Ste14
LSGGSPVVYVLVMGITPILFWVAIILMGNAWRQVHAAGGKLVTDGLYARVRHPQYSAMFLLIVSLLIQWPTLLTVLMSPILFVVYYRLAMREEREMEAHASRGPAYLDYKSTVPAFIPRLSTRMARPAGGIGTAS